MSIPNLPTDFKDDILNTDVNIDRKYHQMYNSDDSVSMSDVTSYLQRGTVFGAAEVNQIHSAINNIYSERILNLNELNLVTETGFFVDALAVKEAYDALNSKITSPYNLANCAFRGINKVVSDGGSSRKLFTLSELNSIFGVSAERQDYNLFVWNGDGSNNVHVDGATYKANETMFYATLDRSYSDSIRIQGIVIYNPSRDGIIT